MKKWARIDNGVVKEVVSLGPDLRPGVDVFHPSLSFVECTAVVGVACGWTYAAGTFSPPA